MKRVQGYTMVELVATMTVAAVLASIAVPAISSFVYKNRTWSEANSLVLSLNYARSEAIKRDVTVSVCTSPNIATCVGGAWQNGWIVRVNDPVTPVVLETVGQFGNNNTMSEASGISELQFQPNGSVVFVGAGVANATFKACDQSNAAKYARMVAVNLTGRIVSGQGAGLGVNGAAIACP
jgi:type IV fimbrial biogenesis protein FimT